MSGNDVRLVAREGIPVLIVILVLAIAAFVSSSAVLFSVLTVLFLLALYIFREPVCELPCAPLGVLSPANGEVLSVCDVEDYRLSRRAKKIRIRMSPLDVHGLRCPTEGKVMNQWSSTGGEQEFPREYAWWIQTDEGDDLVFALGLGGLAVYSRVTIVSGQRMGQGQRCGYLYLAGTFDLYLPENVRVKVEAGDSLVAGASILADYVHETAV